MSSLINNKEYLEVLTTLKTEIRNARFRANLAVNKELILLYWRIGNEILERQHKSGGGARLSSSFPLISNMNFRT